MLPYADEIIVLDQGEVIAIGSYDEIIEKKPEIAMKLQPLEKDTLKHREDSKLSLRSNERKTELEEVESADSKKHQHYRQQGSWSVYGYYFKSAGFSLLLFFLIFATIEAFCTSFQSSFILNTQ